MKEKIINLSLEKLNKISNKKKNKSEYEKKVYNKFKRKKICVQCRRRKALKNHIRCKICFEKHKRACEECDTTKSL